MKRGTAMAAVVVGLACAWPAFLAYNFATIEFGFWRREAVTVRPIGGNQSVAEDAVILAVRRARDVRQRQFSLEWLVVIPSTGEGYSCSYEEGFAGFEKGDTVRFVHTPIEMEVPDAPAYLIGHNQKVARVEPAELDNAGATDDDQ